MALPIVASEELDGVMRSSTPSGRDGVGRERHDAGRGSLADYTFDLVARSEHTRIRLAHSDPHQQELLDGVGSSTAHVVRVRAFVELRTPDDEAIDAPTAVRLDDGGELSGVVGYVPRGLEAVPQAALARLRARGRPDRLPAEVVRTRHGLRVDLLIGLAR